MQITRVDFKISIKITVKNVSSITNNQNNNFFHFKYKKNHIIPLMKKNPKRRLLFSTTKPPLLWGKNPVIFDEIIHRIQKTLSPTIVNTYLWQPPNPLQDVITPSFPILLAYLLKRKLHFERCYGVSSYSYRHGRTRSASQSIIFYGAAILCAAIFTLWSACYSVVVWPYEEIG